MDVIQFAIKKPVVVLVGVILVIMFGVIALFQLPYQLAPRIERPVVSVRTFWGGASPYEIERDIVYYNYWLLRCQIEPNDETLEARKLVYEGDQAFNAAQLVKSRDLYVQGLARWRQVLDSYPALLNDSSTTDPLMDSIKRYRSVLRL